MFKMARDPFDISRRNRNFYMRINHEVKKSCRFKGFLRQVYDVKNLLSITDNGSEFIGELHARRAEPHS